MILAQCAVIRGDRPEAIRWAERAHRRSPDLQSVAALLAALHLADGNPARALAVVADFAEDDLLPETAIARSHALASAGRLDEAIAGAVRALARFPVEQTPHLAALLGRLVGLAEAPGWVSIGPDGRLVGAVRPPAPGRAAPRLRIAADGEAARRLDVEVGEPPPDSPLLPVAAAVGALADGRALHVCADGRPLIGSGQPPRPAPAIEGDAILADDTLEGWAWVPALPQLRVTIRVTDGHGAGATVTADRFDPVLRHAQVGDGRHGFSLDLAATALRPGRLRVCAEAEAPAVAGADLTGGPVLWTDRGEAFRQVLRIADAVAGGGDGGWREAEPMTGTVRDGVAALLRRLPSPVSAGARRPASTPHRAAGVDVVIPVYRGLDETMACIGAVLDTVGADADVVVVDDASPDPALSAALARLASRGLIQLLVNPENLGFPGAANRGLARHPGRDVVLLNSDALVHGDWLARLRNAAYSAADIGTVTPLSNDGEIVSYPGDGANRTPPAAADAARIDALARRCNGAVRVEIPTAVGFCTYIRHDCLAETGLLDAALFGRGYGEENDFSLRARRLGWRHVAAADVFVTHVGGRSFGRRKAVQTRRNLRTVNRIHPGYEDLIRRFRAEDPLAPARRRLDLALWAARNDRRPALLVIAFGRAGGVARFVEERVAALLAAGRRVLLLTPHSEADDAVPRCRVSDARRPDTGDLVFRTGDEIDALVAMLAAVPVAEVEIQHVLDHDPAVLTLPQRLGVPYDVFVHDYVWICPQVCLVDAGNRYCGEPDLDGCDRCVRETPPASGETLSVADLRARSRRVLGEARRVVVPTRDVAERLTRHLGAIAAEVVPWDDTPAPPPARTGRPAAGARRRVCVIGAIGHNKGYGVLLDCARDAARRDLPLEFVVVGHSRDDAALFATGRVFLTGRYDEDEAVALVRRQAADAAFLPSVCPETWSYALSLAWQAGLEVVAFDLGSVAERIRARGGGQLLPPDTPARAINDRLLAVGAVPDAVPTATTRHGVGSSPVPAFPTSRGLSTMLPSVTAPPAQERSLSAVAQALSLQPGIYSFAVVRGDGGGSQGGVALPLPSISLAPAPFCAGDVEMLGGGELGWLSKPGDTVVVKVSRKPCEMILTSYQPQNFTGQALGIQMTRLDAPPGQAQPAAVPVSEIRLRFVAHVQNFGDVSAQSGEWAGSPDRKLWIEGLSIAPLDHLPADGIEYKGLSAKGVETPWVTGGGYCGSRGEGTPLTGLAVRLREPYADRFDCVYEVMCLSGARSPVLANGRPYRSDAVGDPIQAFTVRVVPSGTVAAARGR
ncbi:glycosyltransferase [Azospirillum sp. A39]